MKSKDKQIIDIAGKELANISGYSCQSGETEVTDRYPRLRGSCGCWFTTFCRVMFRICFRKPDDSYDTELRVAHVEYDVCQRCGTVVDSKLSDQLKSHDKK